MKEEHIQNEEDLWDVLNEPVTTESRQSKSEPKPKTGPKFAKPEPVSAPAPVKPGRRMDGFFFACMAGVAAVSVAATLVLGGMLGGGKTPAPAAPDPIATTAPIEQLPMEQQPSVPAVDVSALEQENAELRQQVELQKQQIKDLRAELLDLTGTTAETPTGPAVPGESTPQPDEQTQAYEIFRQIQAAAYEDFDRAKLEELIPEMDKRLTYLSSDALNEYYLILEYVEQPSNG